MNLISKKLLAAALILLGFRSFAGSEPNLSATGLYVRSFELYNASTGLFIRELANGSVIDLKSDGDILSIRARVGGGTTESVRFTSGGFDFVDNRSPFFIAGNEGPTIFPAQLGVGLHTLTATPFAVNFAAGAAGTSLTITVAIVDSRLNSPDALTEAKNRVVATAEREADLGLCGQAATDRYVAKAGSKWCSEFARWVFIAADTMKDSTSELWTINSWNRFQNFFSGKGKFVARSELTRASSVSSELVGNYLLLDTNLDGLPNHSALIVGVSPDLSSIYTVEGNYNNCTKRLSRPFWTNSTTISSKIIGIGKIWP